MEMIKKYKLFSNIKLVKGYTRCLMHDLQREKIFFIPHSLYEILNRDSFSIEELSVEYSDVTGGKEIINEYFDFLHSNELIFEVPDSLADCFPEIIEKFESPAIISNAVVDIDKIPLDMDSVFTQLLNYDCYNIEVRYYRIIDPVELRSIIDLAGKRGMRNIFVTMPFSTNYSDDLITEICLKYPEIQKIFFYGSFKKENRVINETVTQICHSTTSIAPDLDCGHCGISSFNLHQNHFLESKSFNTCLNSKISIDRNENIRNCPSMKNSFGNINDTAFSEVISKNKFTQLWHVNKDQVKICKDCEFRHICTDCRAFLQDPDDVYSKPLKCGYDPYSGVWSEWSKNPLNETAVKHYQIEEPSLS